MKHLFSHRLFALYAVMLLVFPAFAQDDVEVTVEAPGTLEEQLQLISSDAASEVVRLKVNGFIDGNDMMYIRRLCGVKDINTPVEGSLTQLDLSDASIVATDKPYMSLYGTDLTTKDGVFGSCFLYNCRQLESLMLPNSILAVDSFALASCTSLQEIELPYTLNYIGYGAFVGCSSVTSLYVPNLVDSIATGAFQKMTAMTELTLGNGLEEIDNSLILGCDALRTINFGDHFRTFNPIVFYTAPALEEINVVAYNPYLSSEDGVLYSVSKDTLLSFPPASTISDFTFPDGVRRVGYASFYGAQNLMRVYMSETVTTIDSLAFFNCMALSEVALGKHTGHIAFGAFGVTPGTELVPPTEIKVPASLTEIDDGAFLCNNVVFDVNDDNPAYSVDENGFLYDKEQTRLCYVPPIENLQLPATVTAIGGYAMAGSNLSSVYLNDRITAVGDGAFAYSPLLESITLGTGVTHLGDMLVQGCQSLSSVYLFADSFDDDNVAEFAFLDDEGSVIEHCTLFVKQGLSEYFLTKRGFYSAEYDTFFFAGIQEFDNPDGIRPVKVKAPYRPSFFSLDGRELQGARRGFNIIRLPEGRSVKRFLK